MATRQLVNEPLDSLQVYSATYSNVPVYEFLTPNGSVMRRKSDGWVNATHILKVANFPKAKRTRILEKDVQTGVHEKVQGGYGKYQGTWVQLERAIELAKEFEVDNILSPLFDFIREEGAQSPPPAPKHHNASSKASKLASNDLASLTRKSAAVQAKTSSQTPSAATAASRAQSQVSTSGPTNGAPISAKKSASVNATKASKTDSTTSNTTAKRRGRPPKLQQTASSLSKDVGYSPPPQLPPIVNSLPKMEYRPQGDPNQYQQYQQQQQQQYQQQVAAQQQQQQQVQYSPDKYDNYQLVHHPSSSPSDFMSDTDLAAALRSPEQSFQFNKNQRYNGSMDQNEAILLQQAQQQQAAQYQQAQQRAQNQRHRYGNRQGPRGYDIDDDADIDVGDNEDDVEMDDEEDEDEEDNIDQPQWYDTYRNNLLEYFHTPDDGLTETPLPEFLTRPPPGFDINHGVDKENNTALHWACAVGDLRMTEALLQCGANATITNNDGLIPIMRSVLFTNPYERRTFAKLLELLRESLLSVSLDGGKTILHLIAMSTNSKIRLNAAKYYMEMLLTKISAYHLRETVVNYVNKQDHDGNTALHLIAKNIVKKYLKILIPYGARIDIMNKKGDKIEDFLVAAPTTTTNNDNNNNDEQQQQQQQQQQHFELSQPQSQSTNTTAINPYYYQAQQHHQHQIRQHQHPHLQSASLTGSIPRIAPVPHYSEAAIQANQVVANQMMDGLDELANAYDNELQLKEEEINEVKNMVQALALEISEIELQLEKRSTNNDLDEMMLQKQHSYDYKIDNLKKILERSQSKDLATLVQVCETEEQEQNTTENSNSAAAAAAAAVANPEQILLLTLLQYKRQNAVDKMLSTIASNQNYKIDKYKHLMRLCLRGSLDIQTGTSASVTATAAVGSGSGGDTDNDEEIITDTKEKESTTTTTTSNNENIKPGSNDDDLIKKPTSLTNKPGQSAGLDDASAGASASINFDDEAIDEDQLLDILIENLDEP